MAYNRLNADFDFIGFTFDKQHSADFGIYRISDGSRYNDQILSNQQDKTLDNPSVDGKIFTSTKRDSKVFNISFAYDNMSEEELSKLKKWFATKEVKELIFDEAPYKGYWVKVTGAPSLSYIPFSVDGKRVYKGEGKVSFTAFYPYARTPDWFWRLDRYNSGMEISNKTRQEINNEIAFDGKIKSHYYTALNQGGTVVYKTVYPTIDEWGSNLDNGSELDMPFEVIVESISSTTQTCDLIIKNDNKTLHTLTINLPEGINNIHWESDKGLVYAIVDGIKKPLNYTGNAIYQIPKECKNPTCISDPAGMNPILKYHYWYY